MRNRDAPVTTALGTRPITVLLMEDNPGDARLIQELLRDATGATFDVECADRLAAGLERLAARQFGIVLLDLALPDSQGLDTFSAVRARAHGTPIIVLTGQGDEQLALKLVQEGAQDYLVKGQSDGPMLARTIRYGIERQQVRLELQASQERMRAIVETALDAIVTMDASGTITGWSPQAEIIFGWPATEAVGRVLADTIIPPEHRAAHQHGLARFSATQAGPILGKRIELTALHRDGHQFPVELAVAPIRLSDGWMFSAFIRDISERKQAELEITRLNETLERRVVERTNELVAANQELEAFTYSVSHDLRTPLRHVSGFVRILVDDFRDALAPQAQHYLQRIEDGARHMGRLVDDLLNLARVGKRDLRPGATPLTPLVQRVIASLEPDMAERRIDWRVGALPVVECDAGLMELAFTNLLSNAVKYTRPRAQAVIEVGQTTRDGAPILFVRDNGVGFDMKYADKLFGVFQRLHRAEDFEGTGVGLATVQRIIRKHGGSVWAEAAVDTGATFYFTLGVPANHPSGTRTQEIA